MEGMRVMNRRNFVQSSASTVALAAFSKKLVAANDKVTLAMVGVRGQGANLTRNFARLEDVNIAYLCDVDQNVFGKAAKTVEEQKGKRPQLIGDLRRALEDKSVIASAAVTRPAPKSILATSQACTAISLTLSRARAAI